MISVCETQKDLAQQDNTSLFHKWKHENNERARDQILKNHKPLLLSEIQKVMKGQTLAAHHRHDLMQEAALAFCLSLEGYDPTKGASVGTWAQHRIRNHLKSYVLNNRAAWSLGGNSDDRKAYYAAMRLKALKKTELTEQDVHIIQNDAKVPHASAKRVLESLSQSMCTTFDVIDTQPDAESVVGKKHAQKKAMKIVREALMNHSERERDIFLRLCSPEEPNKTETAHIAQTLGVSTVRIHQIRRNLLEALHQALTKAGLKSDDLF